MAVRAAEREGKRHPLSLRVTADIRHQLEAAASASGRSLTQEAEFRLEQSFVRSSFHEQAGIITDVVAFTVTQSAMILGDAPLATFRESRYTFQRLKRTLERLAHNFGVLPISSIVNEAQKIEAGKIEGMADQDDVEEKAARDRWSIAFGKWSRALEDVGSSPDDAARILQERMAAKAGLTIPPTKDRVEIGIGPNRRKYLQAQGVPLPDQDDS